MTEALAEFVKDLPKHLKRVHIVIFQSKMLPDFQEAIKELKKISSSGRYETHVLSISGAAFCVLFTCLLKFVLYEQHTRPKCHH